MFGSRPSRLSFNRSPIDPNLIQIIAPDEITNPHVDDQSVMTYLSQFPKSKLSSTAPLRPKTDPKKARAYGKGIEPIGNKVRYLIFKFLSTKKNIRRDLDKKLM